MTIIRSSEAVFELIAGAEVLHADPNVTYLLSVVTQQEGNSIVVDLNDDDRVYELRRETGLGDAVYMCVVGDTVRCKYLRGLWWTVEEETI